MCGREVSKKSLFPLFNRFDFPFLELRYPLLLSTVNPVGLKMNRNHGAFPFTGIGKQKSLTTHRHVVTLAKKKA